MNSKNYISFCVLFFVAMLAHSQGYYLQDINGRIILETRYVDVQGSPYLTDNWSKAEVKLADGITYQNVDLKYDQVEDKVFFKSKAGDPLEFVLPVNAFNINFIHDNELKTEVYQAGFKPVDGNTETTFFQIIADGSTKLLKRNKKVITSSKPYNSASTLNTISTVNTYYLVENDGVPEKIKLDKKSIIAALSAKAPGIEAYIKENKLDLKNDADLNVLFTHYNQLK